MPSGAKKRKAAKKKKEQEESNNSSSTLSPGDDDLKVIDEKDSDGGDSISPTSQDHHNHQHPFTEGEEEMVKREDKVGSDNIGESTQKVAMEERNVIQIDWEIEHEDYADGENVSVEKLQSAKKSHGGSSSSSSSSDDESNVIEKNIVVIESGESKEETAYSVAETIPFDDSIKTADLPEVTRVTESVLVMDAYNLAVAETKEEAYDLVAVEPISVDLVKVTDLPEVTHGTGGVSVVESSSLVVEEASESVLETILVDSKDASKEVVRVNDDTVVENPTSFSGCESGSKENGKHESSIELDMGSEPKEDRMSPKAVEYSAISSVAMSSGAQEVDDKLPPSSSVPAVFPSNGAEHVKDSVVSECSDSQPVVVSAPPPVQTTSWRSCCGLFELFTGSNR